MGRHKKTVEIQNDGSAGMTLNHYLSNHSSNRNLDKVIIAWYSRRENNIPLRTKEKWDFIVKTFNEEIV